MQCFLTEVLLINFVKQINVYLHQESSQCFQVYDQEYVKEPEFHMCY